MYWLEDWMEMSSLLIYVCGGVPFGRRLDDPQCSGLPYEKKHLECLCWGLNPSCSVLLCFDAGGFLGILLFLFTEL
jgi:hypothetical protein